MVVNGNANVISDNSLTDPTKHAELFRYLENLKKDEDGWRNSLRTIVSNSLRNVEEHFLLLQVIEDFLQRRYSAASPNDVQLVRELLLHWMKVILDPSQQKLPFIVNKMAHIFSMVFAVDFPMKWPSFFEDLFFSNNLLEPTVVRFYMKVLLAIDSEVVDRDIQRSKEEADRNIKIKDAMREICIQKIAQSWPTIMNNVNDDSVQCLVLEAIAAYVDWIDVDLIANDTVMSIVIQRLGQSATSEAASNAVCALLQKGMPPEKKVKLVITLMDVLRGNNLLAVTEDSDEDEVLRVGSLVNTLGLVLIDVYTKLNASSILEEDQKRVLAELAALTEPELAVLNNSNPELSELSIDVLKAYLSFLIRNGSENEQLSRRVIELAFSKYIMGEGMNIDGDGEDETEFVEYRKDLRSLLNVIGTKRPELVLLALEPWTAKATASGGAQIPINQIEALLQIVFSLHEIIPSNLLQSPREGVSERACRLPLAILENLVLDGRSTTVHVVYFELACRYERLLAQNPQPAVPLIAAAFLDERGIAIPAVNVRTRIVYLFCRFVKAHKVVLSPLVSEVVKRLAPLLAVAPESENSSALSSDDQAYIFEATATLIVFGELDVELKSQYFGELASTLAIKFEAAVTELSVARSQSAKEEELKILQFMSNIIAYCSRMSKAFNNVQSMKSCNCVDVYLKLLKLFLSNLNAANVFILESVRQFAHRLVVCLEAELLPYLREIFEKLAEASTDLDTMNHLMIFCHQTVAKYKKDILTSGVDIGNVLVTAARFSMQEQENIVPAKDDSQRALVYVQRSFVQLLHAVIVNDCWPALQNSNGLLDGLLETTMRLAMSGDQTSQKLALATLARATQKSPAWSQRTLRVALEVPALPHITPSDAGSTLVVHEACATLLTLFGSDPTGFSQAVRELLPSPFSDQLINALSTLKGKNLDKEVMNMYVQLKSRQQQQRQQIA